MQFLVLARVVEGVSIEQVLPHVKAEAEAVWHWNADWTNHCLGSLCKLNTVYRWRDHPLKDLDQKYDGFGCFWDALGFYKFALKLF